MIAVSKHIGTAVACMLLCVGSVQAAEIAAGQWIQLNFTHGVTPDGAGGEDGFNYFASENLSVRTLPGGSTTNTATYPTNALIDSTGAAVDGSVSGANWNGSNAADNSGWPGHGELSPSGHGAIDGDVADFWWGYGDETITVGNLNPNLRYDVYVYSVLGIGENTLQVDVNGSSSAEFLRSARFAWSSAPYTPYVFTNLLLNASGELEVTFNGDNPFVNAIVIQTVTPAPLQSGDAIAVDISSAGGSATNFNVIGTSGGSLLAGTVIDYHDGAPRNGISIALSAVVGLNNDPAADNWGGTAADPYYVAEADDIAFKAPITLTVSGLDDSLSYNARVYALIGNNGHVTDTITVTDGAGTQSDARTRGARWAAATLEEAGGVFESLQTDGSGKIVITCSQFFNAVVLEVLPSATVFIVR